MSKETELYKEFIDGMVGRRDSMSAKQITAYGSLHPTTENQAKNNFIASLSLEQRQILCELLQDEHISGIHDTLAYINEQMDIEGLQLIKEGIALHNDSFESLHYDFMCRASGDKWPD